MKLIIQIPCYNEEKTLPITLRDLPQKIMGIDEIDVLVIDDGSTDKTIDVAKENGVKMFCIMPHNSGLGRAFSAGLQKSLELGADIIVNFDADNQYCSKDIEKLVNPIIERRADITIGARPLLGMKHWSFFKRYLQVLGSKTVGFLSSSDIKDATSGFRAFSRDAALKINSFEKYSHTQETIMQAKAKELIIKSIPIRVNPDLRKSRLMRSMASFVIKQSKVIIKNFVIYNPFTFFLGLSHIFFILFILCYYLNFSALWLLFCGILIMQTLLMAIFSLLLSHNRKLLEDVDIRLKNKKD